LKDERGRITCKFKINKSNRKRESTRNLWIDFQCSHPYRRACYRNLHRIRFRAFRTLRMVFYSEQGSEIDVQRTPASDVFGTRTILILFQIVPGATLFFFVRAHRFPTTTHVQLPTSLTTSNSFRPSTYTAHHRDSR